MENIIIILVVAAVILFAVGYIIKAKKKGAKCIGCPYAQCPSKNKGNCCCENKNAE